MSPPQSQSDSAAGLRLPQVAACLLVGYFVFRWFFKSNDLSGTAQRRPPPVDPRRLQQQTEVIRGMFPQVSVAAVQAELIRNGGNIEITTEKILTNGFLPEVSFLHPFLHTLI
jgi:coupling of ubiquitin conjugation to ER degradation protein 1